MVNRPLVLMLIALMLTGPLVPLAAGQAPSGTGPETVTSFSSAVGYVFAPDGATRFPGDGVPADRMEYVPGIVNTIVDDSTRLTNLVDESKGARDGPAALAFATHLHESSYTVPSTLTATGTELPTLLARFYQLRGVTLTSAEQSELTSKLNALDAPTAKALATVLKGYNAATDITNAAYANLQPGDRAFLADNAERMYAVSAAFASEDALSAEDKLFLDSYHARAALVDQPALVRAAHLLLAQAGVAKQSLNAAGVTPLAPGSPEGSECVLAAPRSPDEGCVVFEDPKRLIVVTGRGHARVAHEVALQLDLGGDTTRENRAGGADLALPVALSVDMGGLDAYASPARNALGSGTTGVGVLVDFGKEPDSYAVEAGGMGHGAVGVGLLVDEGGPDLYLAAGTAMGTAVEGTGILLDQGTGDDRYVVDAMLHGVSTGGAVASSHAYGGVGGAGVLLDLGGNDEYTAAGAGTAQGAGLGGVGWLVDASGDAIFQVADRGQAYSGTGLGVVVAGASGGPGLRTYRGGAETQARATLGGISLLAALQGADAVNDYFEAGTLSQANGGPGAVALLYDAGGNDIYEATTSSQAYADLGASVLLANMAGIDGYSNPLAQNDAIVRPTVGAVIVDQASDSSAVAAASAIQSVRDRLARFKGVETSQSVLHLPISRDVATEMSLDGVSFEGQNVPLIAYYMPMMKDEDGKTRAIPQDWSKIPPSRCLEATYNYQKSPCQENPTPINTLSALNNPWPPLTPPAVKPGLLSGSGTTWSHNADTMDGWIQLGNIWHVSRARAHNGGAFYFGFDTTRTYDDGGQSASVTGSLTSPVVHVPTKIAGKPTQLAFWKWHQVEYWPEGMFDVLQLQVCPVGEACTAVRQWDSQGESHRATDPFVRISVPLDDYAGRDVRFRFVFDSRDSRNNNYEGWYLDDFVVFQGEETRLKQIVTYQTEWHETTNEGRPAIERQWMYEHQYTDGSVKRVYRVEQFISIDSRNLRRQYVDIFEDVEGRVYSYTSTTEYVKKDVYSSSREIRPYQHKTYNHDSRAWVAPTTGTYYAWYKVWEKFESTGSSGSWGSGDQGERTFIHLIPNSAPNGQIGEPLEPKPGELNDKNGNGFWVGLKAFAKYNQGGTHNQDANWMVETNQRATHSHFAIGLHVLELDKQFQDAAATIAFTKDLAELFETWLETRGAGAWAFVKGAFKMNIVGFVAGWALDVIQTGDLAGLYMDEDDTPSACVFGACVAAAFMGVTSTPGVTPFGLPVPVPGHLFPDDDSWNKEFDLAKAIGQAMGSGGSSGPQRLHFEDFDRGTTPWAASQGSLWHRTAHRGSSGGSAYFGRETSWNYDTGKTETGALVSPSVSIPSSGAALDFDLWTQHETCTDTRADILTAYWYDGEWHSLRRWSSDDGEAQQQSVWKHVTLDLSPYRGKTGQVVFHVNTVDPKYNNYEGWYVDTIEVSTK